MKFLAINGSLRTSGSLNGRLLARAMTALEDVEDLEIVSVDLKANPLPFFDQDIQDEGFPENADRLKAMLDGADALLIAQPEYNFSMPAVLKNYIDWMSRYRPQPFKGKHAFLMSASPSSVGGGRGLMQLQVPLNSLGVYIDPNRFSLSKAPDAFNDDGSLTNEIADDRLVLGLHEFVNFVRATK